jgi:uncharacterized protein (DUF433 family)
MRDNVGSEVQAMAHETLNYRDRIVDDSDASAGKPVVKGTNIAVEQVFATLAATPDVEELLQTYPELTRDDLRAVFSYAYDRLQVDDEPEQFPRDMSPQDFYSAMTRRPDVSELMRRLAR